MPEFTQQINSNGHRSEADGSEAADIIRSKVDEARAIPRPASIGEFYVESRTEEAVKEQKEAYEGNAESEAAAPEKTASELSHQAKKAEKASDRRGALAEGERKRFEVLLSVLGQHCRRGLHAALVYWLVRVLIVLGDLAGASGAILLLGEEPFNAFAQATSVAVSAVALGIVGMELSRRAAAKARQKPLEELTEEEKACASFFTGPGSSGTAKILGLAFIVGIVAIVAGIFTLREAAEGQEVAIAFGCFASAVCLASFLNSYEYGCEVSDFLEVSRKRLKGFEKDAAKASGAPVIAAHDKAEAEAKSIKARNEAEGRATGHDLRREMYEKMQERPELYGDGSALRKDS